jgi:FkbM family methyltransferase
MNKKYKFVDPYLFFNEELLTQHKTFLEVGSFTGTHAKKLMECYDSKVIIYEASKSNFKLLNKNTPDPSIIIHNKAIGKNNNPMKFYEFTTPSSNSIYPRHVKNKRKKVKNIYTVECITLQNVLKENKVNLIDVLFCNCEGSEIDILDSFFEDKNLHDKIKQLSISFHPQIYGTTPINNIMKKAKLNGFNFVRSEKKYPCTLFFKTK